MKKTSCRTKVRHSKPTQAAVKALVKATRVKTRAQQGTLTSNLVRPYTRKVYWDSVLYFFQFLALFGLELPLQKDDMDDLLCQAMEYAWENGETRALAVNMISGLEHHISGLRGLLKGAKRLWRQWGKLEDISRAPPLDTRAVLAMCWYLWDWGYTEMAVIVLLAFHRFLRPMDYLQVKVGQFLFPRKDAAHLVLANTKTSGTTSIPISDPAMIKLLHVFTCRRQPGDLFMPQLPHEFRLLFDAAIQAIGLPHSFKPYSLRRGGASSFFQATGNYHRTMELGNWRHLTTAKIYVNTALLELTQSQLLNTHQIRVAADAFLSKMR